MVGLSSGAYTVAGGLRAVIYTDVMQVKRERLLLRPMLSPLRRLLLAFLLRFPLVAPYCLPSYTLPPLLQFFVLLGGILIILAVATNRAGGIRTTVDVARAGGRLTFFEPSVDLTDDYRCVLLLLLLVVLLLVLPLLLLLLLLLLLPLLLLILTFSTWNLLIGGIPYNLVQLATDQISVQRYLSARSIETARNGL